MSEIINPPICIASPVRRSGTTLLQRLLCSASNTVIYGENCANDFVMQVNLFQSKHSFLVPSKDVRNEQLRSVLDGNVNDWIPDLMPDIDTYMAGYKDLIFALAKNYGGFAAQKGRPIWGMKLPEWQPFSLKAVQTTIPGTKIIYLHRNLADCVCSAKGIEMLIDINEVNRFCQIFQQYTHMAKEQLKGVNVLHLNYEDLLANPTHWIATLERFSGAENIDSSVLSKKVNTYANDPRLEKEGNSYLAPAELTKEEQEIINSYVKNIKR